MSGVLTLPAPAKLNVFLHVLGRRGDGYHELETLFIFLDHGDTLILESAHDGTIARTAGPQQLPPQEDLSLRAARALKALTGVTAGARIAVHKRLPMGGGLGGGSSDAATVLHGLNRLWETGLDVDALAELGLTLGADVPVFVRGQAAFASGIGERLVPVTVASRWFLVVVPPVAVQTADVFADHALTRNTKPLKIGGFLRSIESDSGFDALWQQTRNDCESVVAAKYPAVAEVLGVLRPLAPSRLTGTGGCVFAVFNERHEAVAARAKCAPQWLTLVARGLSQSPLRNALEMAD